MLSDGDQRKTTCGNTNDSGGLPNVASHTSGSPDYAATTDAQALQDYCSGANENAFSNHYIA
jgi:hypothetical protein